MCWVWLAGLTSDGNVTAEQMEAYVMQKKHWDDPMNNMQDTV